VAEITIDIVGKDSFSNVLGNFGSIITGIESAINLVGDAFRLASDAIQPFINSASESELAITKLEAVLSATGGAAGLTSEELQNLANDLQGVTRFSDETILTGATLMLTFRNIGEETMLRAIPAMLDMAEIFGSVDAAAMQLGKALNDPVNMMGALSRAGVTFTEEQKEMIKTLVESGDLLGAQNIILTELEMQVGGVAEAVGGTFVGAWEIAKNVVDEFRELIGGPIIAGLTELLGKFNEFIATNEGIQAFKELFGTLNELLGQGAPLFSAIAISLDNITLKFPELTTALAPFVSAFVEMQKVIDDGGTVLDAFIEGMNLLAASDSPLAVVAEILAGTTDAFQEGGFGDAAGAFITGLFDAIADELDNWITAGGPAELSEKVIGWIDDLGEGEDMASTAFGAAFRIVSAIVVALGEVDWSGIAVAIDMKASESINNYDWTTLGSTIANSLFGSAEGEWSDPTSDKWAFLDNMPFMFALRLILGFENSETISSIWNAINNFLSGAFSGLENWTIIAEQNIDAWWAGLPAKFSGFGQGIVDGFMQGIQDVWADFQWFWNAPFSEIITNIKKIFGITSPSTVFFAIGKDIVQGLINGITSMFSSLSTAVGNMFDILTGGSGEAGTSGTRDAGLLGRGGIGDGTIGGRIMDRTTSGGGVLAGGTVTNIYNFYAPVYMSGVGPEGTYDCAPSPLISSGANPFPSGYR
jgi:methyl-accepting chemotaxis protein